MDRTVYVITHSNSAWVSQTDIRIYAKREHAEMFMNSLGKFIKSKNTEYDYNSYEIREVILHSGFIEPTEDELGWVHY